MKKINIERLMQDIEKYALYGNLPEQGISRQSFSEPDYQVRELFTKELEAMGIAVHIDPIANIWGTLEGTDPDKKPIVIGSHLDTVPNGGKYDGALGVLAAKEVLQTLLESGKKLNHPLQIVSFTAEESNEFNFSTMGSRVFTRKLGAEELEHASNQEGRKLADAVKKAGGNLSSLPAAEEISVAAYFELHIEQGKKLEKQNLPVGVVDKIVGIYREIVTVEGEQNHSGTTMMDERRDALAAAGEMAASVQKIAKNLHTDTVATVGKFQIYPNSANIIPGLAEFILEVRSANKMEREKLIADIHQSFTTIKESHGVELSYKKIYNTQECEFNHELVEILKTSAEQAGIPYKIMPSMAGHDAMHIADKAKAAMLFVKSIGGISHNPAELSLPEDIEQCTNVLLNAIIMADEKL